MYFMQHRRNTGNSQPDLQDDNESVFTTMPQAQLQGRDIEMLNKLRAKMNSFPDAVVRNSRIIYLLCTKTDYFEF